MLMIDQLGLEGYGIYWVLIETLREQPEYKYPLQLLPVLAKRYFTSGEKMKAVVANYDLFQIEGETFFFSESLCKRMAHLEGKREQRRIAANIRWEKEKQKQSESNATAMQSQCESNADEMLSKVKVSKGKVSKVKVSKGKVSKEVKKDPPAKKAGVDFIDKVVQAFCEAHGDYTIVNKGKERAAAGKLVSLYKKKVPGASSEETIAGLLDYFKKCIDIDDPWMQRNMSLSLIISKFNEINKLLKNGKGKQQGVSEKERQAILDRIQAARYDDETR